VIWTERTSLAEDLWRYGEDELWTRVLTASDRTMERIGERAMWHAVNGPHAKDGSSMLLPKALALAAIEVLEEAPRPLRRERRRPARDFPGVPRVRGFVARRIFDRAATRARKLVAAASAQSSRDP
jgi:hypothetical protein